MFKAETKAPPSGIMRECGVSVSASLANTSVLARVHVLTGATPPPLPAARGGSVGARTRVHKFVEGGFRENTLCFLVKLECVLKLSSFAASESLSHPNLLLRRIATKYLLFKKIKNKVMMMTFSSQSQFDSMMVSVCVLLWLVMLD